MVDVIELAVARLKSEEGFRSTAYRDSAGHLTIGFGFNVDAGISEFAAAALLAAQVSERETVLLNYPWYATCDPVRRSVLLDVAFNLGVTGLLKFHDMILAIGRQDWADARAELLDSKAARQLPQRYKLLADLLFTGAIT